MTLHPDNDKGTGPTFNPANPADTPPQQPPDCIFCPVNTTAPSIKRPETCGPLYRAETPRKDIISMLSHDIRTPLTIIMANAEMLPEFGTVIGDDHIEAIERIKKAAHNTSVILEDFLTILSLEPGGIGLKPSPVPLQLLVSTTISSLKHLVTESSATIYNSLPDGLPDVMVDEDRFPRVITNIVTNSLRHGHNGVNISISARLDDASVDRILLEVSDDGPGMSKEDLDNIFDWDSIRKKKSRSKGHGLGLMIVKTITELHGGSVDIDSGDGSGTTVRLSIPTCPSTP
jgi:signal transduction histidine kinase